MSVTLVSFCARMHAHCNFTTRHPSSPTLPEHPGVGATVTQIQVMARQASEATKQATILGICLLLLVTFLILCL
jgi:hypothetical protein